MNLNDILERIRKKCREQNCIDVINEIDLRIESGSTGSEITAMVGKYLVDLKQLNSALYKSLENEILYYLQYCKEYGIIIS
ncbi:MAG: hypothetical protein HZA79_11660 [Sphingobacteriales bacterium]|nr:hypothetical protein [Sphingobacteriales bacterium]